MSSPLVDLLHRFAGLRLLVVGEAMLDGYLHGRVDRICREAPVPIVELAEREDVPGGAANAAANGATLGASVEFVSACGADDAGMRLRAALETAGVDPRGLVAIPGRETLAKERVLGAGQLLVRLDRGTTAPLDRDAEDTLIAALTSAWTRADAVIVSDYGYGILGDRVREAIGRLAAAQPRPLLVDARDPRRYREIRPDAVKPNYEEALRLLGEPESLADERPEQIARAAGRLARLTGARLIAVTLDRDGAMILERRHPPHRVYARPAGAAHVAGAGDTFSAALVLALAAGASGPTAGEIAIAAASVAVAKDGTAHCRAAELAMALASPAKRLDTDEELGEVVAAHRRAGKRIVLTSGCFDLLHRGHVAYLTRAKALGDVLVVAVNGDGSVRRLKGADRPVNGLDDRLGVLEALSCIDHVVAFEEDRPDRLIEIVRPDVFAKGGDYRRSSVPEASLVERLGGEVRILPYIEERSTSAIIARVRDALAATATAPISPSSAAPSSAAPSSAVPVR
jgi:D-beta-D-heptose 7-phosphate kinase/D-beta-D-heptose 1-phosphate adenosyltransferase